MGDVNVPKALYPVFGKPNLEYTLDSSAGLFSEIYIFVKQTAVKQFEDFIKTKSYNNIRIIPIASGLGDGHAVLSALNYITKANKVATIIWGDAHFDSSALFEEITTQVPEPDSIIPCIFPVVNEDNPYVTFIVNDAMEVQAADFSKLQEVHSRGLHDQSMFKIHIETIKEALKVMHFVMWKNGRYVSESRELNFLHSMHYLNNSKRPAMAYITENSVKGFNTKSEVEAIEAS
jgi:bifunctional N-acetylglucosamine-1-phosphate-uridyltransferase/glucosamine-1-phosphate-acetyltransferase GlmU-like protein